jgi:hypothetical protein
MNADVVSAGSLRNRLRVSHLISDDESTDLRLWSKVAESVIVANTPVLGISRLAYRSLYYFTFAHPSWRPNGARYVGRSVYGAFASVARVNGSPRWNCRNTATYSARVWGAACF